MKHTSICDRKQNLFIDARVWSRVTCDFATFTICLNRIQICTRKKARQNLFMADFGMQECIFRQKHACILYYNKYSILQNNQKGFGLIYGPVEAVVPGRVGLNVRK